MSGTNGTGGTEGTGGTAHPGSGWVDVGRDLRHTWFAYWLALALLLGVPLAVMAATAYGAATGLNDATPAALITGTAVVAVPLLAVSAFLVARAPRHLAAQGVELSTRGLALIRRSHWWAPGTTAFLPWDDVHRIVRGLRQGSSARPTLEIHLRGGRSTLQDTPHWAVPVPAGRERWGPAATRPRIILDVDAELLTGLARECALWRPQVCAGLLAPDEAPADRSTAPEPYEASAGSPAADPDPDAGPSTGSTPASDTGPSITSAPTADAGSAVTSPLAADAGPSTGSTPASDARPAVTSGPAPADTDPPQVNMRWQRAAGWIVTTATCGYLAAGSAVLTLVWAIGGDYGGAIATLLAVVPLTLITRVLVRMAPRYTTRQGLSADHTGITLIQEPRRAFPGLRVHIPWSQVLHLRQDARTDPYDSKRGPQYVVEVHTREPLHGTDLPHWASLDGATLRIKSNGPAHTGLVRALRTARPDLLPGG